MAIMITSCKKGDTGPQGPEGNANVKSGIYEVSNWTRYTSSDVTTRFVDIDVPGVTTDIANYGAVLVYYSGQQITSWTALPYLFPSGTNNISYGFLYHYAPGVVEIEYYASDGSDPGDPGTVEFQIVVIEGGPLKANPKTDLNNYEEVRKTFNLQGSN